MMAAKPAVQGPVKDNDPIVRDAEVYAADLGIGLQEAMRRLSLQTTSSGTLLLSATFRPT